MLPARIVRVRYLVIGAVGELVIVNGRMIGIRPGHDVKLHPHFQCHWQLFVLMCHEAGQSAFLHTQLYSSTNLDYVLFSNVSWH